MNVILGNNELYGSALRSELHFCAGTNSETGTRSAMIQLAVIADDLTGAADTAIRSGVSVRPSSWFPIGTCRSRSTRLRSGPGVYTDSRHLSPADAAARVRQAGLSVKKLAASLIYKKIDSCLRGNIGAEVEALLGVLGSPCAFIAPAHPAQGRTTLHDIHFVRGVPLAASEVAHDPVCPIRYSQPSRLIALQSRFPVGRIDVTELDGGLARRAGGHRQSIAAGAPPDCLRCGQPAAS